MVYVEGLLFGHGSPGWLAGNVSGKVLVVKCWWESVSGEVLGSLRSHGTRFAYGRLRAQALSQPCLVMESKRLIQESRL